MSIVAVGASREALWVQSLNTLVDLLVHAVRHDCFCNAAQFVSASVSSEGFVLPALAGLGEGLPFTTSWEHPPPANLGKGLNKVLTTD